MKRERGFRSTQQDLLRELQHFSPVIAAHREAPRFTESRFPIDPSAAHAGCQKAGEDAPEPLLSGHRASAGDRVDLPAESQPIRDQKDQAAGKLPSAMPLRGSLEQVRSRNNMEMIGGGAGYTKRRL